MKDGTSLNNKILPYSDPTVVHDTIETSLGHVEDGFGRICSTQDDLKQYYEDHMPPNISGMHPGYALEGGELNKIIQKDSITYDDENYVSSIFLNLGKFVFTKTISFTYFKNKLN